MDVYMKLALAAESQTDNTIDLVCYLFESMIFDDKDNDNKINLLALRNALASKQDIMQLICACLVDYYSCNCNDVDIRDAHEYIASAIFLRDDNATTSTL